MGKDSNLRSLRQRIYSPTPLPLGNPSKTKPLLKSTEAKRETRFELAALALARRCSTTEPFARIKKLCPDSESNQGHEDFQSSALPTELSGHIWNVPETGIEPVRVLPRRILSPVRLPVPPLGHKQIPKPNKT